MQTSQLVIALLVVIAAGISYVAWDSYQERQQEMAEQLQREQCQAEQEKQRAERARQAAALERDRCQLFYEAFIHAKRYKHYNGEVSECEVDMVRPIDSRWQKLYFWAKWEGGGLFGGSGKTYKYSVEARRDLSEFRGFGIVR